MTYEAEYEAKIQAAGQALDTADQILAALTTKATAARAARAGATAATPDKELRRLRDDDEIATERVRLATLSRDRARQVLHNLEHDQQFASRADDEKRVDELLHAMRNHVREARMLRLRAAAIDSEQIWPLFREYADLAELSGLQIDHRIEAPEDRPRDLLDLYEGTARIDNIHVPTQLERTPLGALYTAHAARVDAQVKADLSRQPTAPAALTAAQRRELAHVLDVRGWSAAADMLLTANAPIVQLYEIAGRAHPDDPLLHAAPRVSNVIDLENEIAAGLPRALNICASLGQPFTAASAEWHPPPPPPPVTTEAPQFEFQEGV